MGARRALALAALLALAAGLAWALLSSAPRPRRVADFGVDMGELFQLHAPQAVVERAFASAAAAGLGLARVAPLWELTEPAPPVAGRHSYQWSYDDRIARAVRAAGMRWVAVLAFAPGWASVAPAELHGAPSGPGVLGYLAYARAFARRYRGLIAAYEIWNEENSSAFWRPRPDPLAYAQLYLAARTVLHATDPGVPVLVGGLADGHPGYLRALLGAPGVAGHLDGVAIHPYASDPGGVLAIVRDYRAELDGLGEAALPLYVTEYGWSTSPPAAPTYASPAERGPFIGQVAAALLRSDCRVRMVVFYAWLTARQKLTSADDWYGIAAADGGPTPATRSVARAASALSDQAPRSTRLCASG